MNRRERGEAIRRILLEGNLGDLVCAGVPAPMLVRNLAALLHNPSPRIRWRAVLALGIVAKALPPGDPAPRETARWLIWSMNDESGNLCRMAPEALGELCAARPEVAAEFGPLLPQFLVEEPFEAGALWALCRMAEAGRPPALGGGEGLSCSLSHREPRRRGLARRLAALCGLAPASLR